jgi:tetratricopeptide (TPR) repeat protein
MNTAGHNTADGDVIQPWNVGFNINTTSAVKMKNPVEQFKEFFRFVPLGRRQNTLEQLDRAMAVVRIQSTIRGSLDRARVKSMRHLIQRKSLSQSQLERSTSNLSDIFRGIDVSDKNDINWLATIEVASHHQTRGSVPLAPITSRASGKRPSDSKVSGSGIDQIVIEPTPADAANAEMNNMKSSPVAEHEFVSGNIRIDKQKRKRSKENLNDVPISPEGLRWAKKVFDSGKYARLLQILDRYHNEKSYWADILLPDVSLLQTECFICMENYEEAGRALSGVSSSFQIQVGNCIKSGEEINAKFEDIERNLRILRCLANLASAGSDYQLAEKYLKMAIGMVKERHLSPRRGLLPLHLAVQNDLAMLYLCTGEYPQANSRINELRATKFVTTADKRGDCLLCSQIIVTQAIWHRLHGNTIDAERALHLALKLQLEHVDPDHPHAAITHFHLAQLALDNCEFKKAEDNLLASISITNKTLNSVVSNNSGTVQGNVLEFAHKLLEASMVAQKYAGFFSSLRISSPKMVNRQVIITCCMLSQVLLWKGAYKQAQECLGYCLEAHNLICGNSESDKGSHDLTATIFWSMGETHRMLGNPLQCLFYHERAYQLRVPLYEKGNRHPCVATSLLGLGQAQFLIGNMPTALEYFQQAVDYRTQLAVLINSSTGLQNTFEDKELEHYKNWLARVLILMGSLDEAQRHLDSGSNSNDVNNSSSGNNIARNTSNIHSTSGSLRSYESRVVLAELCTARGRYYDASLLFQRAIRYATSLYNEDHTEIYTIRVLYSNCLRLPGYYAEASELITTALNSLNGTVGVPNMYLAIGIYHRAQLLRDLNQFADAVHLYVVALNILKKILDLSSSSTLAVDPGIASEAQDDHDQHIEARELSQDYHFNYYCGLIIGDMGETLRRQGRLQEAMHILRKGLALRQASVGGSAENMIVIECFLNLVLVDIELATEADSIGRVESSLILLKEVMLPQAVQLLGASHPLVVYIKANAGICANILSNKIQSSSGKNNNNPTLVPDNNASSSNNLPTLGLSASASMSTVNVTIAPFLHQSNSLYLSHSNSLPQLFTAGSMNSDTNSAVNSSTGTAAAGGAGQQVIDYATSYFQNYEQMPFSSTHPWLQFLRNNGGTMNSGTGIQALCADGEDDEGDSSGRRRGVGMGNSLKSNDSMSPLKDATYSLYSPADADTIMGNLSP